MRPALAAAERLVAASVETIGAPVRSVILHGSLAAGGFVAGRSDIDLLIVIDGPLTTGEIAVLETVVRDADVGDASGIDLHVVAAAVAARPAPAPPTELHIGRYSAGFELTAHRSADPDLPVELSMARADGRSLCGADPSEVIGPVPAEWVRVRGRYWLTTWQSLTDDAQSAAHMVLTACRIWRFAVEGVHASKTGAAQWALDRDPSLTVIRQALHRYTVDPVAPVSEDGIRHLLDTVLTGQDSA